MILNWILLLHVANRLRGSRVRYGLVGDDGREDGENLTGTETLRVVFTLSKSMLNRFCLSDHARPADSETAKESVAAAHGALSFPAPQ